MTTLKIKVTKEILQRSKNCHERRYANCAIALTVRDIFPSAVIYNTSMVLCYDSGLNFSEQSEIPLPNSARSFITCFDMSEPNERAKMPELEFEIEIPDNIINQINIDELRPLLTNHPTLELIP